MSYGRLPKIPKPLPKRPVAPPKPLPTGTTNYQPMARRPTYDVVPPQPLYGQVPKGLSASMARQSAAAARQAASARGASRTVTSARASRAATLSDEMVASQASRSVRVAKWIGWKSLGVGQWIGRKTLQLGAFSVVLAGIVLPILLSGSVSSDEPASPEEAEARIEVEKLMDQDTGVTKISSPPSSPSPAPSPAEPTFNCNNIQDIPYLSDEEYKALQEFCKFTPKEQAEITQYLELLYEEQCLHDPECDYDALYGPPKSKSKDSDNTMLMLGGVGVIVIIIMMVFVLMM